MGDRDHPSPSKSCRSRIKEMQATVAAVEERRQQMQLGMGRGVRQKSHYAQTRVNMLSGLPCAVELLKATSEV